MKIGKRIKSHGNLVESFLSLSVINIVNKILPFISLPYMLRIIGPDRYGIYSFVNAIVQYILLFVTYGFALTATKQISQNRDDNKTVNEIYNSVFFTKLIIFIIVLAVFLPFAPLLLDTPSKMKQLFWGLGIVIGEMLMPTYLFQGMEKMRFLAIINVIPKCIFTFLIFFVIKKPDDYEYLILLYSIGYLLAGVISTVTAYYKFDVKFSRPDISKIKHQLKDGASVFGSTLGINLYQNSNILILGLLCSDSVVGIYGAAEKLIKAIQSSVNPLTQALFPYSAHKLKTMGIKESVAHIFKLTRYVLVILLTIALCVYVFAPFISNLILGKEFSAAIPLLRIMTIVIIFGGINYVVGIIGLIIMGHGKRFFYIVLLGGAICILTTFLFSHRYTYYAASWGLSLAEFVSAVCCSGYLIYLYKKSPSHKI